MSKLTPKGTTELRARRHRRIRARVKGTPKRPRLSVFRSNRFIYAQIIDDEHAVTLASATSKDMKKTSLLKQAEAVGKRIAEAAKKKGVSKVAFDRGGFTFSGRIRALADAARAGGLSF